MAIHKTTLILFTLLVASCGPPKDREQIVRELQEAVKTLDGVLPYYGELPEEYPTCTYIAKYPNVKREAWVWTEFIAESRYHCELRQKIEFNKKTNSAVKSLGEQTLLVKEIEFVRDNEGQVHTGYRENWKFENADIAKLSKSNWDLEVLGIKVNKEPVGNVDLIVEGWNFLWGP